MPTGAKLSGVLLPLTHPSVLPPAGLIQQQCARQGMPRGWVCAEAVCAVAGSPQCWDGACTPGRLHLVFTARAHTWSALPASLQGVQVSATLGYASCTPPETSPCLSQVLSCALGLEQLPFLHPYLVVSLIVGLNFE